MSRKPEVHGLEMAMCRVLQAIDMMLMNHFQCWLGTVQLRAGFSYQELDRRQIGDGLDQIPEVMMKVRPLRWPEDSWITMTLTKRGGGRDWQAESCTIHARHLQIEGWGPWKLELAINDTYQWGQPTKLWAVGLDHQEFLRATKERKITDPRAAAAAE